MSDSRSLDMVVCVLVCCVLVCGDSGGGSRRRSVGDLEVKRRKEEWG